MEINVLFNEARPESIWYEKKIVREREPKTDSLRLFGMENFILFPHKTSMGRSIFDCKHVINRTAMSEHEETKKKFC